MKQARNLTYYYYKQRKQKSMHFNANPPKGTIYSRKKRRSQAKQATNAEQHNTLCRIRRKLIPVKFRIPCVTYETNISTTTTNKQKNSQTALFELLRELIRVRFPHKSTINLKLPTKLFFSETKKSKSSSYTKQND